MREPKIKNWVRVRLTEDFITGLKVTFPLGATGIKQRNDGPRYLVKMDRPVDGHDEICGPHCFFEQVKK